MNTAAEDDAFVDTAATPGGRFQWRVIRELLTRPQPVTWSMVALFAVMPAYLFIGRLGGTPTTPDIGLDHWLPVVPAWSFVYWSLFLAALLPVFVVHQQELVRRTVLAYLMAWLTAYAIFLVFPTVTARPATWPGDGFADWAMRLILATDTRYNCFPSLHVAQCFLAAFAVHRVHRGVGAAAALWASLVAVSTLLTKQHYVLDVIAGVALAYAGYLLFLRGFPRDATPERERRNAPALALMALGVYASFVAVWGILYAAGIEP